MALSHAATTGSHPARAFCLFIYLCVCVCLPPHVFRYLRRPIEGMGTPGAGVTAVNQLILCAVN